MPTLFAAPGFLALAMLAGVLCVCALPELPPRWPFIVMTLCLVMTCRWRLMRAPTCFLFGFTWMLIHATQAMQARIPESRQGTDVAVTGYVEGLPTQLGEAVRFVLQAETAQSGDETLRLPGKLQLTWYGNSVQVQPCSRWHLTVRLKRPHGLVNPGGLDTERVALARRVSANGYVREDAGNRMIGTRVVCIDSLRQRLSDAIALYVADRRDAATLQAFTVGDTRELQPVDWDIARANGIPHLLAISGFHVGIAAMAGIWIVRLAYLLWPGLGLCLPRPRTEAVFALLVAAAYGWLAGLGLATVRTLLMIAMLSGARFSRRSVRSVHALAWVLVAMLLLDPLAVLSAGFWLSFAGVVLLMTCMQVRQPGWRGMVKELVAMQLLMSLAMLPLTLWFFGEASLVGFVANLVAIPVITLLVVPGTLLAILLLLAWPLLAMPLLWGLGQMVHALWWMFGLMAQWPGAHGYVPGMAWWSLLLAAVGVVWMFAPRGVHGRALGSILFAPMLWPASHAPVIGAVELWVLDVGQGLAIMLRTRHHALVYDTGASHASAFNMGDAVVLPTMRALGWRHLDRLVISHAHDDHAGGAPAVMGAFPLALRSAGEPQTLSDASYCHPGERWTWDGVQFSFIHPAAASDTQSNDRSCVLLVQTAAGAVVLTGDITRQVESRLIDHFPLAVPTVLLAPHHGSRTSSSQDFIDAVQPTLVLVSAGWRSRFGHPHPHVIERFEQAGIPWLNTADMGAIRVEFPTDAAPRIAERWRPDHRRFWREAR